MKSVLLVATLLTASLAVHPAQAATMSSLVTEGFEIRSIVRYGIDGEREVYLQRDNALFICWIQVVANERDVIEFGCRQLAPEA